MKVLSALDTNPTQGEFQLPHGLIGFKEFRSFEIFYQQEELPFCWLRLKGPEVLHFVVIDPMGVIPDYEPELFDDDAGFLGIESSEDASVFNIVTVSDGDPPSAVVNLVGPIVINRKTGRAKQVVLANYHRYSAHHPLVMNT